MATAAQREQAHKTADHADDGGWPVPDPSTLPAGTTQLSVLHPHPRDRLVAFEEHDHKYYRLYPEEPSRQRRQFPISTTGLVHCFFKEFDLKHGIACARRSKDEKKQHYKTMTDDEIADAWERNRNEAAAAGTKMHKQIELYYNGTSDAESASYRQGREWQHFMAFDAWRQQQGLVPWRTEWSLFDDEDNFAGQIDMVYRTKTGEYVIYDWKRTRELKTDNRYDSGFGPLEDLDDCNYNHFILQLNIYQYVVERNYGIKIADRKVVLLHPDQTEPIRIDVPLWQDLVADLVRAWKKKHAESQGTH